MAVLQPMRKIFRLLDSAGRVWQIGEPPPIRGGNEEPSSIVDIQRCRTSPEPEEEGQEGGGNGQVIVEDDDVYTVVARFTSENEPELNKAAMEIDIREGDVDIVWALVPWSEVSSDVQTDGIGQ